MSDEIDFTGVGRIPTEGLHRIRIEDMEKKDSQAGNPQYLLSGRVIEGESEGCAIFDNFPLSPKALFRLQNFLEAITGEKPDGPFAFDPNEYVGEEIEVAVVHEVYENKTRAKVKDYFPANPF